MENQRRIHGNLRHGHGHDDAGKHEDVFDAVIQPCNRNMGFETGREGRISGSGFREYGSLREIFSHGSNSSALRFPNPDAVMHESEHFCDPTIIGQTFARRAHSASISILSPTNSAFSAFTSRRARQHCSPAGWGFNRPTAASCELTTTSKQPVSDIACSLASAG